MFHVARPEAARVLVLNSTKGRVAEGTESAAQFFSAAWIRIRLRLAGPGGGSVPLSGVAVALE